MNAVGNINANAYYECRLPNNFVRPPPGCSRQLETFIRNKYEHLVYIPTHPGCLSPAECFLKKTEFVKPVKDAVVDDSPTSVVRDTDTTAATAGTSRDRHRKSAAKGPVNNLVNLETLGATVAPGKSRRNHHHNTGGTQHRDKNRTSTTQGDANQLNGLVGSKTEQHCKSPIPSKRNAAEKSVLTDLWSVDTSKDERSMNKEGEDGDHNPLSQSPQVVLGYSLKPPTLEQTREGKIAATKHTTAKCLLDPESMGFGPSVYPNVIDGNKTIFATGINPIKDSQNEISNQTTDHPPQAHTLEDAIRSNLAAFMIGSQRS